MKKRYLLICFVFVLHPVMAQKAYFDSLKRLVENAKTDPERFRGISELINNYYGRYNPDSSIIYGNQLTAWGKKLNDKSIMVTGLRGVAFGMYNKGDYPGALNNGLNALRIIENTHDTVSMAWTYSLVGDIYKGQQNYSRALYYYQHAKQLSNTFRGLANWSEPDLNLAFVYERTNVLDSALYYAQRYLSYKDNLGPKGSANYMYGILGNVYFKLKKYDTALGYYRKGYNIAKNQNKSRGVSEIGINLSNFYAHANKPDSAIYYARRALLAAKKVSYNKSVYEAATLLGSLYESRKMPDSAFKYLKLSSVTKDSLYNASKAGEVADLTVSELARQNEIQAANAAYRSSLRIYVLGGALLVFLSMALLQWINSGQKKRAYVLLKKQKEEIEAQRAQALMEAALEKVRGRSLAMHASNELQEVVNVVFEKLNELGITMDSVNILIPDEATKGTTHWVSNSDKLYSTPIYVPFFDSLLVSDFWRAKEDGADFLTKSYTREEKNNYFEYAFEHTDFKNVPDDRKKQILAGEGFGASWAITKNAAILIINYSGNVFSENENGILKRFANVFEQAYTRFLDLQKAEAQAREGQIQLGLERVRARAMAMQTTEELNALVATVFEELTKLDFVLTRCLIMIFDPQTLGSRWWMANSEDPANPMSFFVQNHDSPAYNSYVKAWGERLAAWQYELKGKVKQDWDSFLFVKTELSHLPAAVIKGMTEPGKVLLSASFNNFGCLTLVSLEPLSNEHSNIMLRFAKVFDMSYTRFNDLKQAEAQAREAKIEVSLERVRSKTMAMHNSQDVADTVITMFDELVKLGLDPNVRSGIGIIDSSRVMEVWTAFTEPDGTVTLDIGRLDMNAHPLMMHSYYGWENKESEVYYELVGADVRSYFKALNDAPEYHVNRSLNDLPERWYHNSFFFPEGCLFVFGGKPLSAEAAQLFKRFAGVFGLTYRRYLDLQKAEAQAREAQIEAALERVRAKTMAMHNSADIGNTAASMFDELVKLGIETTVRCGVVIIDKTKHMEAWAAALDKDGKASLLIGRLDMTIHPLLQQLYTAWENKEPHFLYELRGDDLKNYYRAISKAPDYPFQYDMQSIPDEQMTNLFLFPEGGLFAFTVEPLSDDVANLFKRFAAVFGLTYRRYLDLQKAEEQAREAQIEAALERVRGKAMAMRSSNDLNATANIVFIELRKLGVDLVRCGVGLMEKEDHITTIHAATNSNEGGSLEVLGKLNMYLHPVMVNIYKYWEQGKDYFPVLEGKSLKAYYEKMVESGFSIPRLKNGEKQYGYFLPFADGCLYAWSGKQESETTVKILKRFTSVIGLTYTRYMELQKAEINTMEAIKQASLDRVRAEIASMRKPSDLERITPLIWNELTILGIPFIRCGVFIMDEKNRIIHTYLSTPDGQALATFQLSFDADGIGKDALAHWQKSRIYTTHWTEEEFALFSKSLVDRGAVESDEKYRTSHPPTSLDLHFFPFLQGMLYVGNTAPLGEGEMNMVQSLAEAFSTAYARYEDFNKLELAKLQVDKTLTELKATQKQLIQSEKMASLGELTAGVAHEIQNPLNFVNNFSEVSAELIGEMDEELDKGDIEEAKAIAANIRQNLEKIRHHGGRADGIVKGMLQHSRASSAQKEPTDLNALADEYLRLAYHGLRAKNKEFNAELVTDFDDKLPKPEVVPQDIGRVLINLYNNAFYAMQQKAKTAGTGYKPELMVTTCREDGQVIIKVKDNGNGIPDAVKDKIMQPFFTTKPTGEGTGLGLSLSYDIVVKGHGGSISVDTKDSEFTSFTVILPII